MAKSKKTNVDTNTVNEWALTTLRGSLADMVAELDRRKATKMDFVADARTLKFVPDSGRRGTLRVIPTSLETAEFLPCDGLPMLPQALDQAGQRCSPAIPVQFLRTLAESRAARAADLLTSLAHDTAHRHMFRSLDGAVRAVLSDRYRVIDNETIAFSALDIAREVGAGVLECSLTDRHMRIKLVGWDVYEAIEGMRTSGDNGWYAGGLGNQEYLGRVAARSGGDLPGGPETIHPVVTISNSETGHGGFNVRLGILRAACYNLATVETVASRVHLGEKLDTGVFSAETVEAETKSITLKARDAMLAAFNPAKFKEIAARISKAAGDEIPVAKAEDAVGAVVKDNSLTDEVRKGLLAHFLTAGQMHRYGLAQAVARSAQDTTDPDLADTLESVAGALLVKA